MRRTHICLDCRTLCISTCPLGHSRVVPLRERDKLVHEVWGRQRPLPEKKKESFGGWNLLSVLDVDWFGLFLVAGVGLWALGRAGLRLFRKRQALRLAQGARRGGAQLQLRTGQVGHVRAGSAFGVELRHRETVMLRDGATEGFDVKLDSGAVVRVPAGLCAFDMTEAPAMTDVESYLAGIDPWRTEPDPFPHDDARRVEIRPGDRVELLCELEPCAAGASGYRDSTTTLFAPRGFVRLRCA